MILSIDKEKAFGTKGEEGREDSYSLSPLFPRDSVLHIFLPLIFLFCFTSPTLWKSLPELKLLR